MSVKILTLFFLVSNTMLCAQQKVNVQPGVINLYEKGLQGIGPDFGNNPASENFYNQMRDKFAALGIDRPIGLEDIEGSIYYNDKFRPATISFEGVEARKVFARYNAFNDEFEIKSSDEGGEKTLALFKDVAIACELDGKKYNYFKVVGKKGEQSTIYLTPISTVGTFQLMEQKSKRFKEGKQAKTSHAVSFPHRFVDEINFYLIVNGAAPKYIPSKKNEVIGLFDADLRPNIKSYIKTKKLDLKSKSGLIELVAYAGNL